MIPTDELLQFIWLGALGMATTMAGVITVADRAAVWSVIVMLYAYLQISWVTSRFLIEYQDRTYPKEIEWKTL